MFRFLLILVMLPLVASADSITWVNDGGDGWVNGEDFGGDDLNEIKTSVDDNAADITNLERASVTYVYDEVGGGDGIDQDDIMAALDRACTQSTAQLKTQCGQVVIPAGTYTLTDTVFLTGDEATPSATTNEGIWSLHLRGAGGGFVTQGATSAQTPQCKTILKWDGSSADPMIHAHGARDSIISDLCLLLDGDQDGTTGTPPASHGVFVTADTTGSENESSVGVSLRNVTINGFSSSYTNSNTHDSICVELAPDDATGAPNYTVSAQIDDFSIENSNLYCHYGVILAQGDAGGVVLMDNRYQYENAGVWVEDSDVIIRGGYSNSRADSTESDGGAEATACGNTVAFLYIDANADHVGFYDHRVEADCGIGIKSNGSRDDQTILQNVELAIGGADAYGCTDLYDTGGPPQTSGSPDGYCDSDGTTVNGQNAIIDYAHEGTFIFDGFLGVRNSEVFANMAVYLHPGTGRLEFCERSNIDDWGTGAFTISTDAFTFPCVDANGVDQADSYTWTGTHDFSGATVSLPADVVTAAEMADADHGDVAWLSGIASVQDVQNDAVDIEDLSATGTASSSTFLRGDNTWATPAGSSPFTDGGTTIYPTSGEALCDDASCTDWQITAAGAASFTSVTVSPSTAPSAEFKDSDMGGTPDINASIVGNCPTGTTAGANEDCDLAFSTQVAGSLTEAFRIDTTDAGVQSVIYSAGINAGTHAIRGAVDAETTSSTTHTLSSAQGQVLYFDEGGAGEIDLPALSLGASVLIYNTTANAITVDPNGTEVIVLNGTAASAGEAIVSSGATGEIVSLHSDGTNWYTLSTVGTWSEATP